MEHAALFLVLASCFGFFMAWGVGANDVANAMGTSVGSKVLTITQAVIIAAIFESLGALLAGGSVTDTIRSKIIDFNSYSGPPEIIIYGMLASILAAGSWLVLASYKGWPVSTTHSIIGALLGFGVTEIGFDAVHWNVVGNIVLSWLITPIMAGVISYSLFRSVQRFILNTEDPVQQAKRIVPFYIFLLGLVVSMVTLTQGLAHVGLNMSYGMAFVYSASISLVFSLTGIIILNRLQLKPPKNKRFDFKNVENVFGTLMLFTACSMAFAHGSNDVANAIGPLAAIVDIIESVGSATTVNAQIPLWILALGATGIVFGLVMYGYRVIATIGQHITELTPSRGFAADLATSSTVVIASGTGLPISTTQTLVGAILGVGLARGIGALRLHVIRNIFMSWITTIPAGAILTIICFYGLKTIFA